MADSFHEAWELEQAAKRLKLFRKGAKDYAKGVYSTSPAENLTAAEFAEWARGYVAAGKAQKAQYRTDA